MRRRHLQSFYTCIYAGIAAASLSLHVHVPRIQAQQNTQEACNADIDQAGTRSGSTYAGIINLSDYTIFVQNFLRSPLLNSRSNIDKDVANLANLTDYVIFQRWFLQSVTCPIDTPSPTQTPTSPPQPTSSEWNQDAGNAQRTGYIGIEPNEPWSYVWSFNGPDPNGGSGNHFYNAHTEGRTVTGNNTIFIPATSKGLYALTISSGKLLWNIPGSVATFNATPAYADGFVYAAASSGMVYKIQATDGKIIATYNAGSAINRSVLVVESNLYVVSDNGTLHKINTTSMTSAWIYQAGASAATLPSYSAKKNVIVYATKDLFVHAVNAQDGIRKWRVKPTPNTARWDNDMEGRWPVIAEQHGIVFIRMSLAYPSSLWQSTSDANQKLVGPNGKPGVHPSTNAAIRSWLQAQPQFQNLFALNLDNGEKSFIPAVGYTGVEDLFDFKTGLQKYPDGEAYLDIGPMPVVKTLSDGKEVAYIGFRNGQNIGATDWQDGRWDGHMGEMVLDNTTVPGMVAGDMRFIEKPDLTLIDEQNPLTVAGNTIFHAHWGANQAATITDRGNSLGLSYQTPIKTQQRPHVVRRTQPCGTINTSTHWTSCAMSLFSDTRYYGPGFWVYWNTMDPPIPQTTAFQSGLKPFYTYVSGDYIIVEGSGGDIFVLKHS